jgi:deoxyadenosine/deoxycytidine kinase
MTVSLNPFKEKHPDFELIRHLRGSIILLDGNIGSGKTNLCSKLTSYLNEVGLSAQHFDEEIDDDFLELFLSDMRKHAFAFQLWTLSSRLNIYLRAMDFAHRLNGVSIVDRSVIGDLSFARMHYESGNISADEWKIYGIMLNKSRLSNPLCLLYLDVSAETSMKRIQTRNRGSESSTYTLEYLESLRLSHEDSLKISGLEIKRLDWNKSRDIGRDDLLTICGLLNPKY